MMKITILKQMSRTDPFYMRMPGGSYGGSVHYFTLFGKRIVINTIPYFQS